MSYEVNQAAEQYVWERLHEGLTGQQVVALMAAGGWSPGHAEAAVERVKTRLLTPIPHAPGTEFDLMTELPGSPAVVWPADVLPPEALQPQAIAPLTITETPVTPHDTNGPVTTESVSVSPPPVDFTVPEPLLERFPHLRARVQAIIGKARELWYQWAQQAEWCRGNYDALRAEAIHRGWDKVLVEPRSTGKWPALVGFEMGGLILAGGAGLGLMFLGYIVTPACWLLLGVCGLAAGGIGWLLLRLAQRPRGGELDPPHAIDYARRLTILGQSVRGGFASGVHGEYRQLEWQVQAISRQAADGVRTLRQRTAEAPVVIDSPVDVRAELSGLEDRSGRLNSLLDDDSLTADLDRVTKLPRQSPARNLSLELEDALGRRTRYPVSTLNTAREHLKAQIAGLAADCERLRRKLEEFSSAPVPVATAHSPVAQAPPEPTEDEYVDLRTALQYLLAGLDRHGRVCVEAVDSLRSSTDRVRDQFNEASRQRGWAVKAG